jgi:hypothetical protein
MTALKAFLAVFVLFFLAPIGISFAVTEREEAGTWATARRDPTGLAPDPAKTPEAVIQVYAARAFAWRGIFSVHTWISLKPAGAAAYTRYEVVGWGTQRGVPAIRVDRMGPDNYWFGSYPTVLVDRRGPEAEAMIPKILAAIEAYPHKDLYRTWPGPNSNTFIAHIGRMVPELGLELPNNAVGKDFLADGGVFAPAPSGSGYQLSLFGLAGVLVALDEGIEINLLGLSFGIDFDDVAIKLPALGRLGLSGR